MNVLIIYGTVDGQTEKVANHMADFLTKHGQQVTTLSVKDVPASFEIRDFDTAIIGGSIRMSDYPSDIKKFVTTHLDWLNSAPSAFFTVCMAIHSQRAKTREEAKHFGEDFVTKHDWQPKLIETFAGAVKYTQYNFVTRFIMKLISRREGGSTDTSHDHEYTDWEAVERFAEKFMVEISELKVI